MSNNQIAVQYTNSNTETPFATVAFDAFEPSDQAFCTSRCLSGSDDFWADADYKEPGYITINGERLSAVRVFLFELSDMTDDAGEARQEEDYPWDAKHCARILLRD